MLNCYTAGESGYTVPAANLSDGSNVLMVTGSSGDLTLGPLELTFTKATTPPASVMLQGVSHTYVYIMRTVYVFTCE